MSWDHQIRLYLPGPMAELARTDPAHPALGELARMLGRHEATLLSQYDAFRDYVRQAEQAGPENFPLYRWTKAALADPVKQAKHKAAFAVHVAGTTVYSPAVADALEADLRRLLEAGLIARISHHDTDPANNLPVPAEYQ